MTRNGQSYRHSVFSDKRGVVLEAELLLEPRNGAEIASLMEDLSRFAICPSSTAVSPYHGTILTSGSRRMPVSRYTTSWIWAIKDRTSAQEAPPVLMTKPACFSDT